MKVNSEPTSSSIRYVTNFYSDAHTNHAHYSRHRAIDAVCAAHGIWWWTVPNSGKKAGTALTCPQTPYQSKFQKSVG